MKNKITLISIITLWIDQIIKYIVYKNIINLAIIPNFLSLVYVENKGVAFSMLSGNRILIISVSIIIIILLIYELYKNYLLNNSKNTLVTICYGILFGGIFGNLFDRIFKGYVVDYISIKIFGYLFPVFNLADVLIILGVVLMAIIILKEERACKNIKE